MDKNRRWIHDTDVLKSCEDSFVTVLHPSVLTEWVDDNGPTLATSTWLVVLYFLKLLTAKNYAITKACKQHQSPFLLPRHGAQGTDMFVEVVDVIHKKFRTKTSVFLNCCGNQQRH